MIIKYFSDIHLEFHDAHDQAHFIDQLIGDDLADIIVIAGDLQVNKEVIPWLQYIDENAQCPVLFVPGNHEYYGAWKNNMDMMLKEEKFKNVHVLIQGTFEFMGITFAGATGWWDASMGVEHTRALNDFSRIMDIKENANGTVWGVRDRRFFQEVLEKTDRVICISHNAPSYKSILPQFASSDINECFANHWDKMIIKHQPIAWIHGHMHNTIEYTLGQTEVLCNPYGYAGYETNDEFSYNGYIQIT
jgi:Icc-related predicted phosphoesterase